ncbi:uncharacterized protein TNCV_4592231 [Trichonephila clavipes]|nr:uncharacterized protein TNCV_4592231 [Trichonephila clavipes]
MTRRSDEFKTNITRLPRQSKVKLKSFSQMSKGQTTGKRQVLGAILLNGYVSKQNCRIWSEANPQVYVETPLHPEKLTVWGALWAGEIIGPYFFKNDEGYNVTVNGDRYRAVKCKLNEP